MSDKNVLYMISGSWPPDVCGVGDYMHNLARALENIDVSIKRVSLKRYDLLTLMKTLIVFFLDKNSRLFLSYPTEGFGKSILPFVFCILNRDRVIIHIHEYTSKNKYCRFLLRLYRRMSVVYFSNKNDMDAYLKDTRTNNGSRWRVIPSPSNIAVAYDCSSKKNNKIIHFGQIRPNKGIEVVYDVFSFLSQNGDFHLCLIGAVPVGYEEYADKIRRNFESIGCSVSFNLSADAISKELADSNYGLFPFPDGADDRRGSLNAALNHNVVCLTTYSDRTSVGIKKATYGVDISSRSPSEYQKDLSSFFVDNITQPYDVRDVLDAACVLTESNSFDRIASLVIADVYGCRV